MGKKMFGFALVRLAETSVEFPPRDWTGIMGYMTGRQLWSCVWQGVQLAPTNIEINEIFEFSQL